MTGAVNGAIFVTRSNLCSAHRQVLIFPFLFGNF